VGLLRQREEWNEKEKMLLSQLWAALEEKLESKSMLQESKTTLDKLKGIRYLLIFNIIEQVYHIENRNI